MGFPTHKTCKMVYLNSPLEHVALEPFAEVTVLDS